MWFNHKTVIFGHSKSQTQKPANGGTKRARVAKAVERPSALDMMIHESRFVGYRGETFA